jgi:eukaryotic-like serine/threonine-protein kinase
VWQPCTTWSRSAGAHWIVLELVRGRSLDQVIAADGPLQVRRAADLGRQVLAALSSAHTAGVLHRDVKPSNVLLGPDGRAVLTDFGIATLEGDPSLTQTGMVMGSPLPRTGTDPRRSGHASVGPLVAWRHTLCRR